MQIWYFAFHADFYGYANVDKGKVCSVFKSQEFDTVKNSYPGIWEEVVYTYTIHP